MSELTRPQSTSLFRRLAGGIAIFADIHPLQFLVITAQLALVLVAMHVFRVEETYGLLRLTPLIFGGFILNAALPLRFRLPFFLVLSLVAIGMVLGPLYGALLVALGVGLIGICHLPVARWMRVLLLVAVGGVLAFFRGPWMPTTWASLVLPVLGAMFMFRLAIYLYDIGHEKKAATIWERLSYFFLLPNVCFPLFPVVDYQTFRRTYYDADTSEIYQKGVLWVFRGVTHLLMYRVVYYYLVPSPSDIQGLGGVVMAMVSTYLLYLRISGQFHMIVGLLCLFGFNLPETHHLYYLASSFTDYWRRINIYWKDFMMKLFYYPVFMRTRKLGMTTALVIATLMVFFGTWVLHSYQWYWLRGAFPIKWTDGLFWGILAIFVVVNSVREANRGRKRSLGGDKSWSWLEALKYSTRVVVMFVVITALWSLWSGATVGDFVSLLATAAASDAAAWGYFVLGIGGLILLGVVIRWLDYRGVPLSVVGSHPSFVRASSFTGIGVLLLLLIGQPLVNERLGLRTAAFVESLKVERLNKVDDEILERGYYEGLLEAGSYTSGLWSVQQQRPPDWRGMVPSGVARKTDNLLGEELFPSIETVFKRARLTTNSFAMRDQEYTKEKADGVYRIAMLGSSYEMGWGVNNDEIMEAIAERRLNRSNRGEKYAGYEILNFSVGGYTIVQHVVLAEDRIFEFGPDMVLVTAHPVEGRRALNNVFDLARRGITLPAELQALFDQVGVTTDMSWADARARLEPVTDDILRWGYQKIVAACRARGALAAWVYVPRTDGKTELVDEEDHITALARETGFYTMSVGDAYGDHEPEEIRLASFDTHPNAVGHRLLGERMFEVLVEHQEDLDLDVELPTGRSEQ